MKPSILFVDDESNILDGLKRMLYPLRPEWDMTFCLGARKALAVLGNKLHDVIVTDLLMPDMDGGTLLQEIHKRYPEIIRIVLSGHSGKKLALKAARYAHQFLAKPLQSEQLKHTIERMLTLREVLIKPEVHRLICKMDTLPALPEIHRRIMCELNTPEPSLKIVADLITQDMGLSTNMMKLVNSAFFGLATKVSSPAHAVNLLGLDVISGLVLTVQLFSDIDLNLHKGYNLNSLWAHCLNTGRLCKALACAEGFDQTEQDGLYVAGLLHDVGKLVLLCAAPEPYQEVLAASRSMNSAVWKHEKSLLNCTHAELGGYLLSLWGFSEHYIPTVFYHHCLGDYTGGYPLQTAIVHAANALDHELNVTNSGYDNDRWQLEAIERLGFADRLSAWRNIAEDVFKESSVNEP